MFKKSLLNELFSKCFFDKIFFLSILGFNFLFLLNYNYVIDKNEHFKYK